MKAKDIVYQKINKKNTDKQVRGIEHQIGVVERCKNNVEDLEDKLKKAKKSLRETKKSLKEIEEMTPDEYVKTEHCSSFVTQQVYMYSTPNGINNPWYSAYGCDFSTISTPWTSIK